MPSQHMFALALAPSSHFFSTSLRLQTCPPTHLPIYPTNQAPTPPPNHPFAMVSTKQSLTSTMTFKVSILQCHECGRQASANQTFVSNLATVTSNLDTHVRTVDDTTLARINNRHPLKTHQIRTKHLTRI